MEKNLITSSKVKFEVTNEALKMIPSGTNLLYSKVTFGYIFRDEHGVEALFKLECYQDDVTFYFEVKSGIVNIIQMTELEFDEKTNDMKKCHLCLNESELKESEEQKARRIKNNIFLQEKGIITNNNLMCNDADMQIRPVDEIIERAVASLIVIQVACDINYDQFSEESMAKANFLLDYFGVKDALNSKEERIMNLCYTKQDCLDMDWAYEANWALLWALGLIDDDIRNPNILADCEKTMSLLKGSSLKKFKDRCKVRSLDEILDMYDLYYRYHWATNEICLQQELNPTIINDDVVVERRRGLEWLLSPCADDWYDIDFYA